MTRTSIGGKDCILANVRDISERKRAEEELRTSEAKYRNLVEQIPAITYIAALDNLCRSDLYQSPNRGLSWASPRRNGWPTRRSIRTGSIPKTGTGC